MKINLHKSGLKCLEWTNRASVGLFEHGNETCELQIKHWLSVSQDTKVFLKYPVLLNVCHYNSIHPFITKSFVRYINDLHYHFLSLNITSSLIDFMFCRRQYP